MIQKIKIKLSNDKHLSDLISSSIVSFGLRIIGISFGYLFIWLISRNFGATTVGVFTLAFTLLQIASILARFGLDTALLRFVSESVAQNKLHEAAGTYIKATLFVLFIAILLSLLTYNLSSIIATRIFGNPSLSTAFQVISFAIVPMTLINLNFETLRAMKKICAYAFLQNVSNFLWATFFLRLFMPVMENSIEIITIYVIAVTITWIISQVLIFKLFRKQFSLAGRRLSNMLKTAFPMMVSSSLMLIMGWTDTVMIGMFMDEKSVGVYSIALKIATLTSITLMAINSMAAPKFAELYSKNDMISLQQVVTQSSKMIFWTSLPILFVSIVFSKEILSLFGEEFTSAAWALIILCLGQFVNAISGSVGYILQMTGNEKTLQYIILFSITVNIVLNYLWIPIYGIEGAATASAISMSVWNLIAVYFTKFKINIFTFYIPRNNVINRTGGHQ